MPDIINHSTSICPFESRKSGKEEEKIQKFVKKYKNILGMKRAFTFYFPLYIDDIHLPFGLGSLSKITIVKMQ